ncbi:hypothetical protein S4_00065 [Salmonella phage S4lw]|nr:hypothetical protein S4_00065 [Salmonella phage S4lw]
MITKEQAQALYDAIIAVASAHADYATAEYEGLDDAGSKKREAENNLWHVLRGMQQ